MLTPLAALEKLRHVSSPRQKLA